MIPLSINPAVWPDFSVCQIPQTDYLAFANPDVLYSFQTENPSVSMIFIFSHLLKEVKEMHIVVRTLTVAAYFVIFSLNQRSIIFWRHWIANLVGKKKIEFYND